MANDTKIEWAHSTFNPWLGCTKVSEGCRNCYAEVSTPSRRFGVEWGPGRPRRRTSDTTWNGPARWNRQAIMNGDRRRVFCASLADVFDEEVPDEWRGDVFDLMARTPNLDWLVLTKRAAKARKWLTCHDQDALPNLWLGVSVEDQATADERIPILLDTSAAVRWVSYEPALAAVNFVDYAIDWIVVGGESGPNARPFDVEWARNVVRLGTESGFPVFVKQLGAHPYQSPQGRSVTGYNIPLRDRKGGDMDEWPPDLRVREFPR